MRFIFTFCLLCCVASAFANTGKYRLTLRDDPATTIVIGWNQISGVNPVVHYGPQDFGTQWGSYPSSKPASRMVSHKGMNNHFARITGLQPNTAYYFVIRDSEGTSQRLWFKTAPNAASERLSFIAGGDSRNNRTPRQNANRLVAKLKPHAVLFGGDMTDSGTTSQWGNWFEDWQLTISADGRMYPIVAARGNHEGSNNDLVNLFDVPSSGVYYALNFGNDLVRTYTLNTEISISGNQTTWLSGDLSSNTHVTWKLAQYHKPMRPHVSYKSEGNSQYNSWAHLFYNYNMDLVIECDAHTVKTTWPLRPTTAGGSDEGFIRDDQHGTVYAGEGCWGAPLRSNNDNKNWTRNSGRFNQFKWIFIDQGKMELRTVRVDNAASVGEVPNSNPFMVPSNLDIWNPSNGSVVTILNQNVALPTVSLTAPADGVHFPLPQAVTLSANANDADGSVDRVEFLVNGNLVGTDYTAPYSISYSLPADGAYTLGARAFDNDGNSQDATPRSITVGAVSQVLERRIASSMDDVEENANGSMYTNSSDLELVADGGRGNQKVGMRFTALDIPKGATIDRAYIQFTVDETNSGGTSLTIAGHDTDDAPAFTSSSNNVSNRSKTSAQVSWTPVSWGTVGAAGSGQRTPDLSPIVQEIVDRTGWGPGNDLVLIITGSGERTAEAYDGVASAAALLHVEYSLGGTPGGGNCVTASNATESFESNFGIWNNATGNDIDWTRRSGATPSNNTGPQGAFDGNTYVYMEASSPNYPAKMGQLISDCLDLSNLASPSLRFAYHMLGNSVGTLQVQARGGSSAWTTLWARDGTQGSQWQLADISLASFAGQQEVEIRFNGTTGSSWQGDIVIDAITIIDDSAAGGTQCHSASNDGFESGTSWYNAADDDIDWTVRQGSTPSRDTGPASAKEGNYYIYVESSDPNYPAKEASLVSACYDLTQLENPVVSFDYHLYGASMGTLRLQARDHGGSWTTLWTLSGDQDNAWYADAVSLSAYSEATNVELRFNATTGSGWQSDFALDNIVVASSTPGQTARQKARNEGTVRQVDLGDEFASKVFIYPNPSNTDVYVELRGTVQGDVLSVFSLNGSLILQKPTRGGNTTLVIQDEELDAGTYILNVIDQGRMIKKTFIKN